ncbi:MAG: peptidyl-prolyl cis-trans isomerase [Kiritimatiellia bacterium]
MLVTPRRCTACIRTFSTPSMSRWRPCPGQTASTSETAGHREQLLAHYEQNKESYKTPPQRRAVFTRINIMSLADTNRVTEASAREYYDRNLSQYLLRSTNAVDVLTATNSYVAYSDARAGILFKLAYEEAAQAAQSDASRLYERLLPVNGKPPRDPSGEVVTLEKVAGSFGLQIETSEWVSANAFVPGVELGRQFTKALFDLDATAAGEVTEPLVASNSVYLAKLLDFRPERVPELAEIKERVTGDVRRKIEAESALAAAKKMRDTLQAQVAGGASFTNAARQAGLEVKALTGIQLSAQASDLSNDVKRQLLRSVPGEILAPVADFSGSHQIVRVMARKTADEARYKEVEGQIRGSLRQNRAVATATGYRKMIAAAAKIEPAKGFKDEK